MITLVQRVTSASVRVNNKTVAAIENGLLALVGFEKNDTQASITKSHEKLIHYRIFSDPAGKMNLNIQQAQGELLIVPQFTLVADTAKGLRPSFSNGASPQLGSELFEIYKTTALGYPPLCQWGVFGADMKVELINDGPVTFWLQND